MRRSTGETWIWGGKRQRREAAKLLPEQQPASNEHSVLPKEGKQEVELGVTGWHNKKHNKFHNGQNRWKSAVTKCRTFVGLDIASDHRLVMAGIRIKLRKIPREALNRRFNMERLTDDTTRECFRTQLDKRWKQAKEREMETAEDTWREIRATYM